MYYHFVIPLFLVGIRLAYSFTTTGSVRLKKYDKYIGKVGIYDGLEYWNKEKPFRVDFLDGTCLCFSEDELEKVDK